MNDPARTLVEQHGSRVRGRTGRWMAQCPAHHDRTPSLSIMEFRDGNVWVNCFAGCETEDVLDKLDLTMRDLFVRPLADGREHGIPEGHHGEWLGACLALTPPEHRCAHWGDSRNCTQCLTEQLDAASEARREHRRVRGRRR